MSAWAAGAEVYRILAAMSGTEAFRKNNAPVDVRLIRIDQSNRPTSQGTGFNVRSTSWKGGPVGNMIEDTSLRRNLGGLLLRLFRVFRLRELFLSVMGCNSGNSSHGGHQPCYVVSNASMEVVHTQH